MYWPADTSRDLTAFPMMFSFKYGMMIFEDQTYSDWFLLCVYVCVYAVWTVYIDPLCVCTYMCCFVSLCCVSFRTANTRLARKQCPPKASRSDTTARGKGVLQSDWVSELQKMDANGCTLRSKYMAQIPKGRLVKGPYKSICTCRDCAIYF